MTVTMNLISRSVNTFSAYTIVFQRTTSGVFEVSSTIQQGNLIINDSILNKRMIYSVVLLDVVLIVIALIDIKYHRDQKLILEKFNKEQA